jgi:hypothetical protein
MIIDRFNEISGVMATLARHGLDSTEVYVELKENLLGEAELMAKQTYKERRAEVLQLRKEKSEALAKARAEREAQPKISKTEAWNEQQRALQGHS